MRRIALYLAACCFLITSCSRVAPQDDEAPEERRAAESALADASALVRRDLDHLRSELRPLLVSYGSSVRLLPIASVDERQRVADAAGRWRDALDAIAGDALSAEQMRELQRLKEIVAPLAPQPASEATDLVRLFQLSAFDAALGRIEASHDAVDARFALSNWTSRATDIGNRLLLQQAQSDGSRFAEMSFGACVFSRAFAIDASRYSDSHGDDSVAFETASAGLRANQTSDGKCRAPNAPPRANFSRAMQSDPGAAESRLAKIKSLRERFEPALNSLALPPEDLIPLNTVVARDPLFTEESGRTAINNIEEAAQRPDRWLKPLVLAATGYSGELEVLSTPTVLDLADVDALYLPVVPGQGNKAALLIHPERVAARQDWEAGAIVIEALLADCFRQLMGQLRCATERLQAAEAYFSEPHFPGDPRLVVGALVRLKSFVAPTTIRDVSDSRAESRSESGQRPDLPLGVLISPGDAQALSSDYVASGSSGL